MNSEYTTISVSLQVWKELSKIKIEEHMTMNEVLLLLIHNYKHAKEQQQNDDKQ